MPSRPVLSPAAAAILVAALGYFVDVYDLVLFGVVRVQSLRSLGLDDAAVMEQGALLLNVQMIGMLVGGVVWGVLGDKKGRLSVLFGSILLYSVANLLNAFVYDLTSYAILRFVAGVGLAGELGAGITLVAELLPKERRGIGTTVVASIGVLGAVVAAFVGSWTEWRTAYFIGGVLGLLLLLLRISVHESGIFNAIKERDVRQGDLLLLVRKPERVFRFLNCVLIGLPTWFVIGVLVIFSPEIARAMGMSELPVAGEAVKYAYIGLVFGDLGSGLVSQFLKSRRKAIALFLLLYCVMTIVYLELGRTSPGVLYLICLPLGFSVGYWAVFITTAAEQFGTNLRATVATSVPNFVRGATALLTSLFLLLKPSLGVVTSAYLVGGLCALSAFLGVYFLRESFHHDLDFIEE